MLIKRIRLLFTLDRHSFFLFSEVYFFLAIARILMYRPFVKIAPKLGQKSKETSMQYDAEDINKLKHITHALEIVSRYTFWESKCLVRAIAGMKMLERRRIDCTLYLGTAKDEQDKLIAHAWLRSGPFIITGSEVMKKFIVVEKFANLASRRIK